MDLDANEFSTMLCTTEKKTQRIRLDDDTGHVGVWGYVGGVYGRGIIWAGYMVGYMGGAYVGRVGMRACGYGRVGMRACGYAGVWVCGRVGMRACGYASMCEFLLGCRAGGAWSSG